MFTTRYEELCRFARTWVETYEDAEEAVQEVFVKIWTHGLHLKDKISLDSYLYVVVRNACISLARRQIGREGIEAATCLAVEEAEDKEGLAVVREAVEELPEQCRIILKLVIWEEMKYAEVAEKLGISLNTVKNQMKIAYRKLREKLSGKQLYLLFFRMRGKISPCK